MKDSVRIVVVGDEKVGKTSIIEVLITENFEEDVQPVLPVLVVPKEVTPERVHVSIVDTPGDPAQAAKVDEELASADVVVLVYSVNSMEATERVPTFWLPKFRAMKLNVPIILVGNKIDTRGGIADPGASAKMEAFIKPIMDNFREVDVCIECSAKTVSNISEVFYFAQKAVLHPTGPLYNVDTHSLKPPAAAALRRIFKICDKDGDGGLNDQELNDFQFTCFNVHLQPKELEGVKKVVQDSRPNGGLNADGSLSVEGFIFLHTLFVQKGRLETTWIVLRKFGYDDEMRLTISDSDKLKVADDQSVELSAQGKKFVSDLFAAADKDADGLLSAEELKGLFADCPDGAFRSGEGVLGERLVKDGEREGFLTLDAFMARWAMYVMDGVDDAMVTLLYLGYTEAIGTALKVCKSRKRDRYSRTVSREVLQVAVVGSDGVLKTNVVRGLVGLKTSESDMAHVCSAAQLAISDGSESRTLVLRHIGYASDGKLPFTRSGVEQMDVICVVFDARLEETFAHARRIIESVDEMKVKVPIVLVAAVGDEQGSEVLAQADALCLERGIPTAVRVSTEEGEYGNLYEDLLGVALYPQVACPDYYDSASRTSASAHAALKIVIGTAALAVVAYGAKRAYDYYSKHASKAS